MRRYIGIIAAILAVFLWFQPFLSVHMPGMAQLGLGDQDLYQSGINIGGISYLLLVAAASMAVFGYMGKTDLLLIAAGIGLAIAILFSIQVGDAIRYGLIGELVVFAGALITGVVFRLSPVKKRKAVSSTSVHGSKSPRG